MATETQMARALDAPGVVQMTVRGVKKPLEELSPSEVATWLEEQGLGHLAPSFKHHKIRGAQAYIPVVAQLNLYVFWGGARRGGLLSTFPTSRRYLGRTAVTNEAAAL
jgi:hypothetical protein